MSTTPALVPTKRDMHVGLGEEEIDAAPAPAGKQPQLQHLAPLTRVTVALRCQKVPVGALPHVAHLVSAFLEGDASAVRWTFPRACESGFSLRMLKRFAVREEMQAQTSSAPVDRCYFAFLATKGLLTAVANDNLDVARWICLEYCPTTTPVDKMVKLAALRLARGIEWSFRTYPASD